MPSITFVTPGTVKWICPLNVTSIQVECWGAASGGTSSLGQPGGPGGCGGEYAAEPSVNVTPGVTYYGSIGQGGAGGTGGGAGGTGGNTTWNSGQVTAHGGSARAGGSGSSNTVHHSGGTGGNGGAGGFGGAPGGGGGGGGSGAPAANGNNGANGSPSAGGAGAPARASGGGGGAGGSPRHAGSRGGSPGGGGGGGAGGGTAPGGGGGGQIRITWTSAPGSPSSFPAPAIPFFPAGFAPAQSDLNAWFHDPFAFLETRAVFRARQTVTPQALPSSGVATTLQFDTIDEDPLGGWVPAAFAWGPPSGFSGWYQVTVTLFTAALAAGNVIRPGITAPGAPSTNGALATGYPGAAVAGVEGSYWVYLIGGQDTVQANGTLLNASSNVNTDITFGQQSSMEICWLSS